MDSLINALNFIVQQTKAQWTIPALLVGVLFFVHMINVALSYRLLVLGIYPRSTRGLLGIFCAPFLHANFNHVFFNAIALFVLSLLLLLYGLPIFTFSLVFISLLSGILTWCFGRPAIHVGASGVITGIWGFLVMEAYLSPSVLSVFLAIICIYYFAGILFGILPLRKGVSWEGHALGLLSGIACNIIMRLHFIH